MLLQKENAFVIKKDYQLIDNDKTFIKELIPLSPNWNLIEDKDKIASETRKEIFDYYTSSIPTSIGIDSLKFKGEINSINFENSESSTNWNNPNSLKM